MRQCRSLIEAQGPEVAQARRGLTSCTAAPAMTSRSRRYGPALHPLDEIGGAVLRIGLGCGRPPRARLTGPQPQFPYEPAEQYS
ncbi:hypothetical protein AAW14_32490 [Streptomyces hygroscopicus]|nr:hypothetical protein [Streptomyces hygroscopicus]